MNEKVFIILLNYNGFNDTVECVESLSAIAYDNYEIIIVDNNSTDNSFQKLKAQYGNKHHIISSGKNNGFAFGNNIGINYALKKGCDYILLINNDTTVEVDFLTKLVEAAKAKEEVGLVTGLILNYYNKAKIWYGGGAINWKRFYGYHLNEEKSIKEVDLKKEYITFATGCLMLIKTEVFCKVGLLPEEYFMYYEDVDFCAKILENGYKILFNPEAIIYHKISASSGESESPFAIEWNTRNRLRFIKKYKHTISKGRYIYVKLFFYSSRIIKLMQYIIKNRKDKARALLKGLKVRR